MRFRRSVLIAALVSVLIAPSLFAQTLTVRVSRGNVRPGPTARHRWCLHTLPSGYLVATSVPSQANPLQSSERLTRARSTTQRATRATGSRSCWRRARGPLLSLQGWVFKSLVEVSGKRTIGVVPSGPLQSSERLTRARSTTQRATRATGSLLETGRDWVQVSRRGLGHRRAFGSHPIGLPSLRRLLGHRCGDQPVSKTGQEPSPLHRSGNLHAQTCVLPLLFPGCRSI